MKSRASFSITKLFHYISIMKSIALSGIFAFMLSFIILKYSGITHWDGTPLHPLEPLITGLAVAWITVFGVFIYKASKL